MNSSSVPAAAGLREWVGRHRWGIATLGAAAFVWGAGAVATPAPAFVGGALAAVAVLTAAAARRFRRRRRGVAGVCPHTERARTRVSLALYGTSASLAILFLCGLFVAPRALVVAGAGAPPPASRVALDPVRMLAGFGAGSATAKLPPVWELGSRRPLAIDDRSGRAEAGGKTLRILDLNVWHGYPGPGAREERYERLRDLVVEADADLVLLQESWSTRSFGSLAERLARELGMSYAYARANGSLRYLGFEEGLTILSRHPLRDARRIALPPRTPAWEMRAALGATIEIPGAPLEVWTTHLSHSSAGGREGQARSLAAALAGRSVALLAGDFNAAAGSRAVVALEAADLRPLLSDGIDHLLASPALLERWTPVRLEARRFASVALPGGRTRPEVSDHPALLVELERRAAPAERAG